jgi:hypothetical protein
LAVAIPKVPGAFAERGTYDPIPPKACWPVTAGA